MKIILLSIVIVINVFLTISVLINSQKKGSQWFFIFLTTSLSLWAYTNVHFQVTNIETIAYFLAILSYISCSGAISSILLFSLLFPKKNVNFYFYKKIIIFIFLFFTILSFIPNGLLIDVQIENNPRSLIPSHWIILYGLHIFLFFVLAIKNFFKSLKNSEGIQYQQLRIIFFGSIIAFIFGSFFNLVLPLFNNYTYVWLGPDFSIFFAIGIAYAIIRYRLFDIKIQFQKIFNFFVPIFFSIIVVVLLGFSIIYFFGVELTVNIRLMLLFFALVLVEICKWVLQKTPFHYFFFRKVYKYQVALRNLAETSGTIVQLDALMNRIITVFSKDMSIQEVAIVIFDSAILKKEHVESIGFDDTRLQPWIDPEPTIVEAFDDKKRRTFVTDEIEYELQKELSDKEKNQLRVVQKALQTTGAHMVVALQVRQSTLGFLILGNRFKATYTAEDIALLEEISDKLSVACMHSRMHEAKTVMTRVLQKDIDKATKKLEQQLQENQELSLVKSQFIEVASHQLRTPISVIRNSLEMVLQDYIKKTDSFDSEQEMKTVRLLLNNAFLASDNLNNTLNSILAAEEFIGAQPSPHIDSVRLESFFHKRMIRAQNLLDAKKTDTITYTQSIDSNLPEICMTDEKKLALIIDQLLMNAIFYTKKGAITCRVWSKNDLLYVEITDTGIGIPAAEQHKLFERFVRLKNAQLVVADGAGLGLYLIRKYITLLRGHVFLCSQENEGTTVRVIVPLVYAYVE